jgi:catechol 2,3-dioxygenase-like lactoylglutathione lyase family enzyme
MTTTQTKTHITDVAGVAVPVSDQNEALGFYVGRLGFTIVRDVPMGGGDRWIQVAPMGGRVPVALVAAGDAAGVDTGITLSTADAAADHASLTASGVDVDELLEWPGVPPMFILRDADGNQLKVMEATPDR